MDTRTSTSLSTAPGFPTRGCRPVPLAPEDGGTASGASGGTPSQPTASPSPGAPSDAAKAPASPQKESSPADSDTGKTRLRFKRSSSPPAPAAIDKSKGKSDAPSASRLDAVLARISTLEAEVKASKSEASTAAGAVREQRLTELLAAAEVKPRFHRVLRADLAGVDPLTDAGKAKFDAVIAATRKDLPEAFQPAEPLPDSAWLKRLEKRQQIAVGDPTKRRPSLIDSISPEALSAMTSRRS